MQIPKSSPNFAQAWPRASCSSSIAMPAANRICGRAMPARIASRTISAGSPSSGKGTLHSFCVLRQGAPEGHEGDLPYALGVVKLDEGVQLLVRLAPDGDEDWSAYNCDDRVELRGQGRRAANAPASAAADRLMPAVNSFFFLDKAARQWPDEIAQLQGEESWTYREFRDRALAIGGNLLALGCEPGDRVAFCLANSPRILEVIFGCFAAGLVVVPVNARLHVREMAYLIENSGAKVLVHGDEYQDGIDDNAALFEGLIARVCTGRAEGTRHFDQPARSAPMRLIRTCDAAPEDICWLFYTSGTTGKPKGAIWNHRMVCRIVMNYLADLHNIQPGEVVLHCAPMSHGSGIIALPAVARGATNAITESASFDPVALLQTVETLKVSHIAFMAPTQIIKMLEDSRPGRHDLTSLQAITYGGAPIYVDQLKQAIDRFRADLHPALRTGRGADHDHRNDRCDAMRDCWLPTIRGSDRPGRPEPMSKPPASTKTTTCLPPGKPGEVVARGEIVMPGYWNNPEASAEALRGGWLHTGDIGYFDEQGYLFLLDRAKDMVISGGNNVYPREVEEVLILHPGHRRMCRLRHSRRLLGRSGPRGGGASARALV